MIKSVKFMSQNEAEALIPGALDRTLFISIVDYGKDRANLKSGWRKIFRLSFDDSDPKMDEHWEGFVHFSDKEAKRLLQVLEEVKERDHEFTQIYIHCWAGISRSAAVAKFVADFFNLPFNHSYVLYNKHVYTTLLRAMYGMEVEGV